MQFLQRSAKAMETVTVTVTVTVTAMVTVMGPQPLPQSLKSQHATQYFLGSLCQRILRPVDARVPEFIRSARSTASARKDMQCFIGLNLREQRSRCFFRAKISGDGPRRLQKRSSEPSRLRRK